MFDDREASNIFYSIILWAYFLFNFVKEIKIIGDKEKVKVEYSGNIRYLVVYLVWQDWEDKQWKPYFPNVVGTLANKLSVVPSIKTPSTHCHSKYRY